MSVLECSKKSESNVDLLSDCNSNSNSGKLVTISDQLLDQSAKSLKKFDFQDLLGELRLIFKDDKVDVDCVRKVLASYNSEAKDWDKYAHYDRFRYTRNLVEDNEKYNVMLLGWAEGQGSSIHNHPGTHCFMKILDGKLKETKFEWSEKDNCEDEVKEMKIIDEEIHKKNEITYINDRIGLHRVENPSHMETSASLHIYIPPFKSCKSFDQRTGHSREVKVTFYSKNGDVYTEPEDN